MQKEISYNMFAEIYICEILHFIDYEDICETIKYLEMNRTTRFDGEQLVYILIGDAIWLDKEN